MGKLRIVLVKSPIGYSKDQKKTLQSLGLRRLKQEATHSDSMAVRGMINKVRHLVELEEAS